jgi:hypothetical protein
MTSYYPITLARSFKPFLPPTRAHSLWGDMLVNLDYDETGGTGALLLEDRSTVGNSAIWSFDAP